VEAVIFDMDGLLVDSEPFWRRVEADAFDALGADVRLLLGHGGTMGLRVDEAIAYLIGAVGLRDIDHPALCAEVVAGVVAAIENEAELFPGVDAALDACEGAGFRLALASGSTPPVIDAVLDRFGLRPRFAAVLSAIDDVYGKPHPSIFLRAAGELGVDPVTCVVIEDSLNGCIAAKSARMGAIAIPAPADAGDPRYAIADVRLRSLVELVEGEAADFLGLARERRGRADEPQDATAAR
jgi:sugar-phosphatase